MSVLTLTFQDGTTSEFPFHTGSQLSVTTPDGVNGDRYGSWGEITGLTLGDPVEPDVKLAVTFTADATDVSTTADATDVSTTADATDVSTTATPAFFAGLKSQADANADDPPAA